MLWLTYALATAFLFISTAAYAYDKKEEAEEKILLRKKYRFRYISWICLAAFLTIIPNAKQVAILVGSSYALDFAKSPTGEKVKSIILQKAEAILDQELKAKK